MHYFVTIFSAVRALLGAFIRTSLGAILFPLVLLIIIGTVGYAWFEGWTAMEALYTTVITITTVGYGDLSPETVGGRIFAIFFSLSAIGLAGYAVSTLAAFVIEYEATKHERVMQKRRMNGINDLKNHTIICGASVTGHRVASEFLKRQEPFLLVEKDEKTLKQALLWLHDGYVSKVRELFHHQSDVDFEDEEQKSIAELADEIGVLYLQEDPTHELHLRRAGLGQASGLIVTLEDDRDNMSIVLSARDMAPKLNNNNLRIIAHANEQSNFRRLYLAGANKVISPDMIGGFTIASNMMDPHLGEFWDHMLYQKASEDIFRFMDMHLTEHPEWVGKTAAQLKQERQQMVVAIKRNGRFLYAPDPDVTFKANDVLIFLGPARDE